MKPTAANLIYLWLGASCLLALVLGWLAIRDVDRIAALEANEVYSDAVFLQAANDLLDGVNQEFLEVRSATTQSRPVNQEAVDAAERSVERSYRALLALRPDPQERQLPAEIGPRLDSFRLQVRRASKAIVGPSRGDLIAAALALQPPLEALIAKQHQDLDAQHGEVTSTDRHLRQELAGLVGVGMIVLGFLAVSVVRRVIWPLQDLEQATRRVAGGEPGVRIPVKTEDEFGQVARAFNEMALRVEEARTRLERANAELVALDRYKDEFLGILSHELRTPLNFITGFTSILEDEVLGPLSPDQQRVVGRIDHGAARLLTLVDELLVFSAWRNGRLALHAEPACVEAVVAQAVAATAEEARAKDIKVAVEVPAGMTEAFDPALLKQALVHLVGNAVKFTPCGGIGLGLGLAKAIAEAHGGTIGVKSVLGQGSVFWIHLPRRTAAVAVTT